VRSEIQTILKEFITNERIQKLNDLLYHIDPNQTVPFNTYFDLGSEFHNLLKKSKKIENEIGINPLCKSIGKLTILEKTTILNNTPVFFQEIQTKIVNEQILIEEIGNPFLNPILHHTLKINHNSEINTFEDVRKICSNFNFQIDEKSFFIGNFHPNRFEIYRDLSEIIEINKVSSVLAKLLMLEDETEEYYFDLQRKPLLQEDFDQKKTLELLKSTSVLVHGPPGTGKSQLIVNAIGQALESNLSILIASEKKAALDAVYNRLKSLDLHRFCLVNFSKNENKHLIRDLKKTWDYINQLNENNQVIFDQNFPYFKLIDQILSRKSNEEIRLKQLVSQLDKDNFLFIPNEIELFAFNENQHIIESLNDELFHLLNKLNFNQKWDEIKIIEITSECRQLIETLSRYQAIETIDDIDKLVRNLLLIQGFSSTIYQKYGNIIHNNPKNIKRLYANYLKLQKNQAKWDGRINHWIKLPSYSELELIKELAVKKGITNRIRFKSTWKKWVRTTKLEPITICNEMQDYLKFKEEETKFSIILKEIGIDSTQDLKLINEITSNHPKEDWNWYLVLDDELKNNYKNVHVKVADLKLLLNRNFNFKNDYSIVSFLEQIHRKKNEILNEFIILENLSSSIRSLLQKCSSKKEFNYQFHKSFWKKTYGNLEIPSRVIQKEWIQASLRFEKVKKQNSKSYATSLSQKIKSTFDQYNLLIETPNRKLNSKELILKTELKNGKRILIKEFRKSKQYVNLRRLYESDAKHWVVILKPILMLHPQRIASYFPPIPGLFDIGIIDEASQMPFKNAIGTLQRTKRILIAGDENQMDPSYFFSSNDNEYSIFHQAKYHLNNTELTHHYRSESEDLIAFSNNYFYENKLRFIERANTNSKQNIIHHFVNNGNYKDGINENEAKKVSEFLSGIIKNIGKETSLGIIAFSEAQLRSIILKIPSTDQKTINELQDKNQLFFKTLDQVQGDECDFLIISFGYGKNEDGNFEMRFGPINQIGGDKRLNVLFSRAKKEIHFFSSVRYQDFPISKNESVNLLKHWFLLLVNSKTSRSKTYEIHILDILEKARDVDDFTHLVSIYHERGWKILTS
jgi:superfamily I DNA and/or RNA helicase